MYIYITPKCENSAIRYPVKARLDTIRKTVETRSFSEVHSLFNHNHPYLKYKLSNHYRLIAEIITISDEQKTDYLVCCFHEIFSHNDKAYEGKSGFLEDPEVYGKTHFNIDTQAILNCIHQANYTEDKSNIKPPLPNHLYQWFSPPSFRDRTNEWGIYETQLWVEKYQQESIKNYWPEYRHLLMSIGENTGGAKQYETEFSEQGIYLRSSTHSSHTILYQELILDDNPDAMDILAISPYDHHPDATEITETITYLFTQDYQRLLKFNTQNSVARLAQRYYPAYFLSDIDLWRKIENSTDGNFALSSEEQSILSEVNHPLFINGLAGSGKSTMLFYLFAHYCERYLQVQSQLENISDLENAQFCPPPIFLTCNQTLLENAKQGVSTLLKYHQSFIESDLTRGELITQISDFFQPFQSFLRNLVPIENLNQFNRQYHLSFHRFEKFYQSSFSAANFPSAADSWHAIRAFIKGYSLQELSKQDYQDLPNRERTLSLGLFNKICEQVYPWYQKLCKSENFWDDQDLAHAVLESWHSLDPLEHSYSAIVCDESQDFTKLELELIVRLSAFSRFTIYPPVSSLPFVFAGDPLQTLNPTGFRWESVKAKFYELVVSRLDPGGILKIRMEFKNLEKNYRSSKKIVGLVNCIHLWRSVLLQLVACRPQESWRVDQYMAPQRFIFDQNLHPEQLNECFASEPIILIPCEHGGELDFIRSDAFLSHYFRDDVINQRTPNNILSTTQAKGLEFTFVVLYKFGDEFAKRQFDLADLLKNTYDTGQAVENLTLEYFLNKLYVAVSRAMDEVIVVDTSLGDQALWQHTNDSEHNNLDGLNLLPKTAKIQLGHQMSPIGRSLWYEQTQNDIDLWKKLTHALDWGHVITDFKRDNRETQAQEFFEKGKGDENSDFMSRAEAFYRALGRVHQADLAAAFCFKFLGQWQAAGRAFLALNEQQEAINCFLDGLCWQDLQHWCTEHPNEKLLLERPAIKFMAMLINHESASINLDILPLNDDSTVLDYQIIIDSFDPVQLLSSLTEFTDFLVSNVSLLNKRKYRQQNIWQTCIASYVQLIDHIVRDLLTTSTTSISSVNQTGCLTWDTQIWLSFGNVLKKLSSGSYEQTLGAAGQCFYRAAILDHCSTELFKQAVNCWEGEGVVFSANYYRAKAYLSRTPQNFKYWQDAGDADEIVGAWERENQPTYPLWLQEREFLGWALQKVGRQQDWFEYLVKASCWSEAISLLYQLPKKEFLPRGFKLVAKIANSNLIADEARNHREQYSCFLQDIKASSKWKRHLSTSQLGAMFERVGEYIPTLEFYEGIISGSSSSRVIRYAQERWLVTKQKQAIYLETVDPLRLAKVEQEIETKAKRWKIDLTVLSREPQPMALKPELPAPPKLVQHIGEQSDVESTKIEKTETSESELPKQNLAQGEPLDLNQVELKVLEPEVISSQTEQTEFLEELPIKSPELLLGLPQGEGSQSEVNQGNIDSDDRLRLKAVSFSELPTELQGMPITAQVWLVAPRSFYIVIDQFSFYYTKTDQTLRFSLGDFLGHDRLYCDLNSAGATLEFSQGRVFHESGTLMVKLNCGLAAEVCCDVDHYRVQIRAEKAEKEWQTPAQVSSDKNKSAQTLDQSLINFSMARPSV
jgi:hypothetical protein